VSLHHKLGRIQQEKLWMETILDAVGDCISVHDTDFRILFQNSTHRELKGPHVGETCHKAFCGRDEPCEECPLQSMLRDGQVRTVNRTSERGDTTSYHEVTVTPLRDPSGQIVAGVEVTRDITERKRYEERLRFMSSHDVLTGLNNRLHFEDEILRMKEKQLFPLSIIMTDLDDLKGINDAHGHSAGDHLLQEVAAILRQSFRSADVIARIGGDEFAIILPATDRRGAEEAVVRLLTQLDCFQSEFGIRPSLSIGHATARDAAEVESALLTADHCMYRDKMARTGRAPRQQFHYDGMHH
jgi:diguanylate cyclase (GGDEF)-like protein/PAS domain S-box-containing protein